MLAISNSDRVLDVATGTGAVLRELRRRRIQPARAVGVDASREMLARARRSLPSWELVQADAGALPFEDASFDAATCAYLLHLLGEPDRARIVSEILRVLAPGGRLGVVTIAPPGRTVWRTLTLPIRTLAARSTGALAGLRPLDPSGELRGAGFDISEARRVRFAYPSLCLLATPRSRRRARAS